MTQLQDNSLLDAQNYGSALGVIANIKESDGYVNVNDVDSKRYCIKCYLALYNYFENKEDALYYLLGVCVLTEQHEEVTTFISKFNELLEES